jgi:hypothetical protein
MRPPVFALALALAVSMVLPASAPRADEEAMVGRAVRVEHQSPEALARAVRHLVSGRDARVEPQEELEAVVVRDRPAHVTAIEQAIRQLDVPRPDVVLQVRLLLAGPTGPGDVPGDMQKVVRQLEQHLRFRAYHQVAAVSHRVRSGAKVESQGFLQLAPPALDPAGRVGYSLELRPVVTGTKRGSRAVQLRGLRFELKPREGKAEIRTDLVVPEGETVVVGTAALGDRAVILVVWASPT